MQDIILLGAEYEDVPAVNLPAVGGGTAKFTDTSGVTALPSDVTAGKIYVDADGNEQTGTASGGSAVIEALSVTANGTYTAPSGVDGYSPVTVNVSGGGGAVSESDVNFYDYDGALLYSHTKAEINAMSSDSDLPANPSHTGLTAQGWNWSLAQLKTQLTAMPDQAVNVGQMYVTDDDKTRIYVHFEKGRTSPYLGICPNGTVTVDWGDGSATDTLTGTSLTTVMTVQHVYQPGDYVIQLTAASGTTFAFYGVSNTSHILKKSTATTANINAVYTNAVQKIELGSAARIGNYAFQNCYSLASITIPDSVTSIAASAFYYCYSLASITIPDGVTGIAASAFYYCYSLASITIPDGVTGIGASVFRNCYSLASITIPSNVTSIAANAFNACYGLAEIHFKPTTPPTVANSNAWTSVPSDCKIYVPTGSLSAYTSATNYPSSSTYTYIEE